MNIAFSMKLMLVLLSSFCADSSNSKNVDSAIDEYNKFQDYYAKINVDKGVIINIDDYVQGKYDLDFVFDNFYKIMRTADYLSFKSEFPYSDQKVQEEVRNRIQNDESDLNIYPLFYFLNSQGITTMKMTDHMMSTSRGYIPGLIRTKLGRLYSLITYLKHPTYLNRDMKEYIRRELKGYWKILEELVKLRLKHGELEIKKGLALPEPSRALFFKDFNKYLKSEREGIDGIIDAIVKEANKIEDPEGPGGPGEIISAPFNKIKKEISKINEEVEKINKINNEAMSQEKQELTPEKPTEPDNVNEINDEVDKINKQNKEVDEVNEINKQN